MSLMGGHRATVVAGGASAIDVLRAKGKAAMNSSLGLESAPTKFATGRTRVRAKAGFRIRPPPSNASAAARATQEVQSRNPVEARFASSLFGNNLRPVCKIWHIRKFTSLTCIPTRGSDVFSLPKRAIAIDN